MNTRNEIDQFCREEGLSDKAKQKIMTIVRNRLAEQDDLLAEKDAAARLIQERLSEVTKENVRLKDELGSYDQALQSAVQRLDEKMSEIENLFVPTLNQ